MPSASEICQTPHCMDEGREGWTFPRSHLQGRLPGGSECGWYGVELRLPVWRGLATRCSCPPVSLAGVTLGARGWGGRALCVLRAEKQQNCWQEIVGTVGRGRLVTIPPRPISYQPVGVGQPGGPGRDDLGEAGREQNWSLQCSLWSSSVLRGLPRSLACWGFCPCTDAET